MMIECMNLALKSYMAFFPFVDEHLGRDEGEEWSQKRPPRCVGERILHDTRGLFSSAFALLVVG
jgi:hypothetical protein